LGETFFDASVLAIVDALFMNRPSAGRVDSVLTRASHFFGFLAGICARAPDNGSDRVDRKFAREPIAIKKSFCESIIVALPAFGQLFARRF